MSGAAQEVATLAGGCFWCIEAVFSQLDGVVSAVSGYSGGTVAAPTYEQVSTGRTGHAEAVQITFDTGKLSFRDILEVFFAIHDPTTMGQGPDIGTQYRSAIFYHDREQKEIAEGFIRELEKSNAWNGPNVTQVTPLEKFYPAEEYHQNYFSRHPERPYCQIMIAPKIARLRERLPRPGKK